MADFMFQNVAYRATVYRTGVQMCHIASSSAVFLYLAWKFRTNVAVPHAAVKRQKFDLISHVNASKICTTLLKHTILSLIWGRGTFMSNVKKRNKRKPMNTLPFNLHPEK